MSRVNLKYRITELHGLPWQGTIAISIDYKNCYF